MTVFFNPNDNGFYPVKISDDCVSISEEERDRLLAGESAGQLINVTEKGLPGLVNTPIEPIEIRCKQVCDAIDITAGKVRISLVSPGDLVEEEYWIAYEEAEKYLNEIKEGNTEDVLIPDSFKSDMDTKGLTASEAAILVVEKRKAWVAIVNKIRDIRLHGKNAVETTARQNSDVDLMNVAQPYIDQLNALQVKVGT